MEIREIKTDKRRYMDLLLIGDEQADMIERYLDRGTMYVLDDSGVRAVCVVTDEGSGILEIRNLAVYPAYQGMGYGRQLIRFLCQEYADRFDWLQAGTGDSPRTVPFYERCGFVRHHSIPGYFTEHYDHIIIEDGVQLVDLVCFRLRIAGEEGHHGI